MRAMISATGVWGAMLEHKASASFAFAEILEKRVYSETTKKEIAKKTMTAIIFISELSNDRFVILA